MSTLDTFTKFMADPEAWDMYVTGRAGTGKTTDLRHQVKYCMDNDIPYVVCAYTHKACDILRDKLPEGAIVITLHKFLKKRPTVNTNATDKKHLSSNQQMGAPERPLVLFIDEYSMIGEKDGVDIRAEQDPEYEGAPVMKVVWMGDPHQLPSIGDMPFVSPDGDYQVVLTKIYRQAYDNPLLGPLNDLVDMIEGKPIKPLVANSNFIRGQDIVEQYLNMQHEASLYNVEDQLDVVMLAYTNQRVEELNRLIAGKDYLEEGDLVFSPTTKQEYTFLGWVEKPCYIDTPFNGEVHLESKYKTLEYLVKTGNCQFAELQLLDGTVVIAAMIFGHYQYKLKTDELKAAAALSNKNIETANRGYKAAPWAKMNAKTKLARQRAKAWRDFLSFDECVMCVDFPFAMTVHKSQGSTYHTVLVDTDDLYKCASINMQLYLKLMYVALSRASSVVITN